MEFQMKKWTRWQDYVAVAVGLYVALSTLWTAQGGMSTALMLILGGLLVICGAVNLARPGMPMVEYVQAALGLLLFLSPWLGAYANQMGAAWTSWIGGALAAIVTATAIRPSTEESHHGAVAH
jgi:SPW repeat